MSADAKATRLERHAVAAEAAPGPSHHALQVENAFLRERLDQLEELARDHASLLQYVALLEARLDVGSTVSAPPVARPVRAGAETEELVDWAGAFDGALRDLATRLVPTPDKPSILMIGPPALQPVRWRQFGLPEANDFLLGLPTETASRLIVGPTSESVLRDYAPLTRRYDSAIVPFFPQGSVDESNWRDAITVGLKVLQPRLALFVDCSPMQRGPAAAVAAAGVPYILNLAHNEVGMLRGGGEHVDALREMMAGARIVLVSSEWEAAELASIIGSERVRLYLRGVDLTRFVPSELTGTSLKGLFVADRAGPSKLALFRNAAARLENESDLSLVFRSTITIPGGPNVEGLGFDRSKPRESFYEGISFVIVPADCSGYSQTMMEALACGCPCLVPAAVFSGIARDESGLVAYRETPEELAEAIRGLLRDRARLEALRVAARQFAGRMLARMHWAKRLTAIMEDIV